VCNSNRSGSVVAPGGLQRELSQVVLGGKEVGGAKEVGVKGGCSLKATRVPVLEDDGCAAALPPGSEGVPNCGDVLRWSYELHLGS